MAVQYDHTPGTRESLDQRFGSSRRYIRLKHSLFVSLFQGFAHPLTELGSCHSKLPHHRRARRPGVGAGGAGPGGARLRRPR
eukprot:2089992-Rhodomonas_salina.1